MDKINIESLFNCKTGSSKTLSVYSLAGKIDDEFNVAKLIKQRDTTRAELLHEFEKQYKMCFKKIELANSIFNNDIIFSVQYSVQHISRYNPRDCVNYISKRLNSIYIDTLIIDNTTLFASWKFIEANIQNYGDDLYSSPCQ